MQQQEVLEWRIKIPTIKVDAKICEGVTNDVIAKTVGHFEESSKWNGNVALAAHNRGYNCNFFENIKNLSKGDIIIYSTQEGIRKYKVNILFIILIIIFFIYNFILSYFYCLYTSSILSFIFFTSY